MHLIYSDWNWDNMVDSQIKKGKKSLGIPGSKEKATEDHVASI